MSTLQERINEVMAKTGLTVGEIATVAQVSSSAVTQWKDGPTQTIKTAPATRLAERTGFSALWLATGQGHMYSQGSSTLSELTGTPDLFAIKGENIAHAGNAGSPKLVRVVGTARLGDNGSYDEVLSMTSDGVVEAYSEDLAAYAYRVRGDSLYPAIRDGWILVVEPSTPAEPGDVVLLKLATGTTLVRELIAQRHGSITVVTINGETRTSYGLDELDQLSGMRAVSAIVSPRKWRPRP